MNYKNTFLLVVMVFVLFQIPLTSRAQTPRTDKLYTSSGIGFSFPVGETSEFLKPKFSTTLGLNIGLGNEGLFLYPKLSLHAYSFEQQILAAGNPTLVHKGRATTYLLNMALGYRKMMGDFAFYGFLGGGGGFILTPEVNLSSSNSVATLNNKSNSMLMLETGLGMEYRIGKVSLFLESSFMRGFNKIQDRNFQSIPLSIGIKPNLSSVFHGKK